jgi:hypothetical protein
MFVSRLNSERGSVFLLLGLLASVIIAFVGFGLDTTILGATKRDQSNLAPQVAAAALNAYNSSELNLLPEAEQVQGRLAAAQDRAKKIAKANIDIATTTRLMGYHDSIEQDLGIGDQMGETGRLIPGIWHFYPKFQTNDQGQRICVGNSPCPCSDQGKWSGPCFEQVDIAAITPQTPINSIRVEIKQRDDHPIKTKFMGLVSKNKEFIFHSVATVAQRPMHAVFLVDLSRSSHADTHLPYEFVGSGTGGMPSGTSSTIDTKTNPAEYAFRVNNPSNCKATEPMLPVPYAGSGPYSTYSSSIAAVNAIMPCNVQPGSGCPASASSIAFLAPLSCNLKGGVAVGGIEGLYQSLFNFSCPVLYPPIRRINFPLRRHAKADYRCITVNTPSGNETYLVDFYRGPVADGTYTGPEPLNTMLHGVSRGLDKFISRNIVGDKVAVYGVDHAVEFGSRDFPLTSARESDAQFQEMKETFSELPIPPPPNPLPPDFAAKILKRHRDHLYFPRTDAMFNLPEALRVAYTKLTDDPDWAFVDNEIIVFTDGLSECYAEDPTNPATNKMCNTDELSILKSLEQSKDIIAKFKEAKIRLHVVLVGDISGSHSILKKGTTANNSNRCMSDHEAREAGESFVNYPNRTESSAMTGTDSLNEARVQAQSLFNADGTVRFPVKYFYPNILYDSVISTGGVWAPVRRPCSPDAAQLNGKTCAQGGLEDFLNAGCENTSNASGLLANISNSGGDVIADSEGRLICDSLCSSKKEQVEAYIDEIFTRNPYLPVDSNLVVN